MSTYTIRCIRFALLYLTIGIVLGATMAFDRSLGTDLRPLHVELNVWGWLSVLVYGLAHHMLPLFAGAQGLSRRLTDLQTWAAIAGVGVVVVGLMTALAGWSDVGGAITAFGVVLQLVAALLFAFLVVPLLVEGGSSPQEG
jgi:cbb3-type cytochrome oxidase subunit 1